MSEIFRDNTSGLNYHYFRVWVTKEEEGGYSVQAPDLPGCISEGETFEEALAMIKDAFMVMAWVVMDKQGNIPWVDGGERPLFVEERRLRVSDLDIYEANQP